MRSATLALLACCATLVSADKVELKPAEVASPQTEFAAQVAPGATLRFDLPELPADRKGARAACHVILPAHYVPSKRYPLVAWLGGGEGSNRPEGSFLPSGEFILVGLPYPKGANNPAQANMVGDYARVWEYHRFMLDEVLRAIPNIDRARSVIAGFSNGAHAIDGMLRLSTRPRLTDYFGVFVFAEGGGTGYTSLGALPDLTGKHAYVCWGGAKGSNQSNTRHLPAALEAKGAVVVGSEMAGVGHAFAASEHPKVAAWLEQVALAPAKGKN
jgi:hypothetical protein